MKHASLIIIAISFFYSCKSKTENNNAAIDKYVDSSLHKKEKPSFFPVTSYIKGQIFEIKHGDTNPLKMEKHNNQTDSSWVKIENLDQEISDFLYPEIDSLNWVTVFAETKFLDQTLNAVTLTYDPIKPLPDSVMLRHWDVYINPNNGNITQVYILKNLGNQKMQQLRWNTGKSCNIKIVSEDAAGKPVIEKDVELKWRF